MNGYFVTVLGIMAVALGTGVSFYGQVLLRRAESEKAREKADRDAITINEKLQTVMAALGAAKMQDSKRLTDEKIRSIEDDLSKWAVGFVESRPARKHEVDVARLASQKKELALSSEVRPVYEFILRYISATITAYAAKAPDTPNVEIPDLPENFYVSDSYRNVPIPFKGGGKWEISIDAERPARDDIPPSMTVRFSSGAGNHGRARFRVLPLQHKLTVDLDGSLPDPAPYSGFVECDLASYEPTIRRLLQKQIEAQLLSDP